MEHCVFIDNTGVVVILLFHPIPIHIYCFIFCALHCSPGIGLLWTWSIEHLWCLVSSWPWLMRRLTGTSEVGRIGNYLNFFIIPFLLHYECAKRVALLPAECLGMCLWGRCLQGISSWLQLSMSSVTEATVLGPSELKMEMVFYS